MINKNKVDSKVREIKTLEEKLNVKLDHIYGHTQTEGEDSESKKDQRRQKIAEDLERMKFLVMKMNRAVEELVPLVQI